MQWESRTARSSRAGVCVPVHKTVSEVNWKISRFTPRVPAATKSQSCECKMLRVHHRHVHVETQAQRDYRSMCVSMCLLSRVTLKSDSQEVCINPNSPVGKKLVRCWNRWESDDDHICVHSTQHNSFHILRIKKNRKMRIKCWRFYVKLITYLVLTFKEQVRYVLPEQFHNCCQASFCVH